MSLCTCDADGAPIVVGHVFFERERHERCGGRIRFGPDGLLYMKANDNHNRLFPQSDTMLGGKVLRVTADGAAASAPVI